MLNRHVSTKTFVKKKLGSTLAAVALLSGASMAQAQFNSVNTFNPAGPMVLQPLGGGVLSNLSLGSPFNTFTTGSGAALSTGFGSFNNGFNQGFVLPLNQPFNSQLNAFNAQRVLDTSGFSNFNTQLANFNAQRTAFNARFIQQNSALNVPNLNVPGSSNVGVFTGFAPPTATNPSLNQSTAGTSSFGFSAFNTFNPINNTSGLPVTAGALSTRSFVNNQAAARAAQVIRRPVTGATARMAAAATPTAYPWPTQPPPATYPPVLYIHQPAAAAAPTYPWPVQPRPTTYPPILYIHSPIGTGAGAPAMTTYPWPTQPAPTTYPPILYIHSPMGVGTGTGARSAFGTGVGTGAVVMGGRSVR